MGVLPLASTSPRRAAPLFSDYSKLHTYNLEWIRSFQPVYSGLFPEIVAPGMQALHDLLAVANPKLQVYLRVFVAK